MYMDKSKLEKLKFSLENKNLSVRITMDRTVSTHRSCLF